MIKYIKIASIFFAVAFIVACTKKAPPLQMVFSSTEETATFNWTLHDFTPALPDDWTGYNYLVFEMKASSPERFSFGPITPEGTIMKSIRPFPGAWLRFCIPLDFYRELPPSAVDMAATYNKARPLGMINIHSSALSPLTKVEGLSFSMRNPINDPSLEIRAAYLTVDNPGDTLLQGGYLVDRFGQWTTQDWPGKIRSEAQLRQEWQNESASLRPIDLDKYSQYGGYKNIRTKATGFFRVEQIDGIWWFVDPEGYIFLSNGSNCINASSGTRTTDREYLFEGLRTMPDTPSSGNRSGNRNNADYYSWNLSDRYGENHSTEWINTTVLRMNTWGLNTIANWSSPEVIQSNRVPFMLSLRGLQLERGVMGLPDIYHPDYASSIETAIRELAGQYKDNKWLIGYFVGNEQPWPNQEVILCDRVLAGDSYMKKALIEYLEKYGDSEQSKVAFVFETFDTFLGMVNKYLKKYDPNHLNLGMRFADRSEKLIALIGKHFDVFSYNAYSRQPAKEDLDRISRVTGLPVIIGEYHFGTPGRGMTSGLVQVSDHAERGKAFRLYNEQGYAHPALIGTHWFQWIDQPNTGRGDGENYNIGLVDVTDRPYPDMIDAIKLTFERLFDVHSGRIAPYDGQ